MKSWRSPDTSGTRTGLRRGLATVVLATGTWLALTAAPARAQQCVAEISSVTMAFGEVGPGGGEATDTVVIHCSNFSGSSQAFRLCMFVPDGSPAGIDPRRMTNYNGSEMEFDLYSDSAGTQILGPEGGNYPLYTTTVIVPDGSTPGIAVMPIHGRVHPGQNLPASQPGYETHIHGATVRYAHNAGSEAPTPEQCATGGGEGSGFSDFSVDITADFANACFLSTASELAFGAVSDLDEDHGQTASITLQCPVDAAFSVGLDDGRHWDGQTRRMAGPDGAFIGYELYRDPGFGQRWGNVPLQDTVDGVGSGNLESLTVHGRVPAQPAGAPGVYRDMVTITLTY